MSYELDYINIYECPCGKGEVIIEIYSNDYSQRKTQQRIECVQCNAKYRFATDYLIPEGETIYEKNRYNDMSVEERLIVNYTLDNIKDAIVILSTNNNSNELKKRFPSMFNRLKKEIKTQKVNVMCTYLESALIEYMDFKEQYTHDVEEEKEYIKNVKMNGHRISELRKKSVRY